MSEPFLGEIRIVGFNFPPKGWATCDGQLLPINQNQSLYSLLGTSYGGDGRTTFALPDLRGRTPIHEGRSVGSSFVLGQRGGQETHALTSAEMPAHTHGLRATNDSATQSSPEGNLPATTSSSVGELYSSGSAGLTGSLNGAAIANIGDGAPHQNMQPCLTLNFCIALRGLFPSRN